MYKQQATRLTNKELELGELLTMAEAIANPSFEPPSQDDSDNEIWLLRAPANMDVSAILNGVQLDLQTSSTSSNNNILSRFKSSNDEEETTEYTLTLGDANEIDNVRLLVPHKSKKEDDSGDSSDDDEEEPTEKLVPYTRPFKQQVHLTSSIGPSSNYNNIPSELIVAPPINTAPKSDDPRMRVAYVPRPQREGLKRRWNMPGANNNKISDEEDVHTPPTNKRKKKANDDDNEEKVGLKEEEVTESAEKSSKKSKKKKKEKKSRKSK